MRHVLVAYDGSPPSQRALVRAAELARLAERVTIVNVMPTPGISARIAPPTEARHQQRAVLDDGQRRLAGLGIEASAMAPVGDAATEILAAARAVGADVIVIGRRHGHVHNPVGSVSSRVVRSAPCEVVVVHEDPRGRDRHVGPGKNA